MTSTSDENMSFPSSPGGKPSSSRSSKRNKERDSSNAKERSRRDHPPSTTPGTVPSTSNRLEREKERSSGSKKSSSASVDMSGGRKSRSSGAVPSTGTHGKKGSSRSNSKSHRPSSSAKASSGSSTTTRRARPNEEKQLYLAANAPDRDGPSVTASPDEVESGLVAEAADDAASEIQTTTINALREKNREVEALRRELQRTREEQASQLRRSRIPLIWGKVCLGSLILIAAIVGVVVALAGGDKGDEPAAEEISPDGGQTVFDPSTSVPVTTSPSKQPSIILFVTGNPSTSPSLGPTMAPSTTGPTVTPVSRATEVPTPGPTVTPPPAPTETSTPGPTASGPKLEATPEPSLGPTLSPTSGPTLVPVPGSTPLPSLPPAAGPTAPPSSPPTAGPTTTPTPDPTDSPSRAPSPSPSQQPSSAPTSKCILLETTLSKFTPFDGNKAQALEWLCSDDTWVPPTDVTEETSQSLWEERFVLAVYYYATNGDGWTNNDGWLTSASVCTWYRIEGCNGEGLVAKFRVRNNRSTGSIPSELWTLTNLQELSLFSNYLAGTIPSGISALTELSRLSLAYNDLSGSLPDELGSMTRLTWLAVQENYLEGTIPSLPSSLTGCRLAGEAVGSSPEPSRKTEGNCFTDTTNALASCVLSANQCHLEASTLSRFAPFDGNKGLALDWLKADTWEPPEDAADETALWEERFALAVFYYATNGDGWTNNDGWLTSASVCSWFRISACNGNGLVTKFHLWNNRITGSIPSELWTLTNLESLRLYANYLAGTIPSGISALTELSRLSLAYNDLSGSLPDGFGSMTQLTWLAVQENYLEGTIPALPSSLTTCKLALDFEGSSPETNRKTEGNCFTDAANVLENCDISANCP